MKECCTTPGGGQGKTNHRDLTGGRFQKTVPSLPMNDLAKYDLIISVAFLDALGI